MTLKILTSEKHKVTILKDSKVYTSDRRGCGSRAVFLFDDFVVKFASYNNTDVQNRNELNFYLDKMEAGDEKYFPKMLDFGWHNDKLFLVQERCYPRGKQYASAKIQNEYNALERKYGFSDQVCQGDYVINCMITDDGLKIYDLGIYDGCDRDYRGW